MPNYFANGSPWASDVGGFTAASDAISRSLLELPRQKNQQQLQLMQMMLERQRLANEQANQQSQIALRGTQMGVGPAHAKLFEAEAGQKGADAMKLLAEINAAEGLRKSVTQQGQAMRPYGFDPSVQTANQNTRFDAQSGAEGYAAQAAALTGNPQKGADFAQQNAANVANDPIMKLLAPFIATGTKITGNVPAGGMPYDFLTGQAGPASPRTLRPGEVLRENTPGEQGLPVTTKLGDKFYGMAPAIVAAVGKIREARAEVPPDLQQALDIVLSALPRSTNSPTGGTGSTVSSKEEFDALPSGTVYTNSKDGKQYKKP